jgi:transposase
MSNDLFGGTTQTQTMAETAERPASGAEPPRIVAADRRQLAWTAQDLESLLAADHKARLIWAFVEKLDLSRFYATIAARGSDPGRPATDPKVLLTLWLYATSEGVGSARELDRLCRAHDAYRWICGGVPVNHHTLSDFRVDHEQELDDLLTQVLAVLMHQGLVSLERVAQDGTRVRASAGAASFRREDSLQACLVAAREQVELTKKLADEPGGKRSARERAAAERATREREERLTRALEEMPLARKAKPTEKEKREARVSTTDPEARVMKMGDGGFRPAYNVQFATDTGSRAIVGVEVTNSGSDKGQMPPMIAQIEKRTGKKPKEYLVDGGFTKLEDIESAHEAGVTVFAPVQKPRQEGVDPHLPKDSDTPGVAAWRERMGTPEAKRIYKERAATAETVNGDLRTWRGLDRFLVRGNGKVRSVALWAAITYNLMRWMGAA